MNTNTTLPVVALHHANEGPDRFLAFDWTDGRGDHASVTIGLDMATHDGGQAGLRDNMWALLQHVYLMGVDAASVEPVDTTELLERNQRQMERIETLVRDLEHVNGLHANQARVITEMRVEHESVVEQGRILLESRAEQIRELTEERDALARSLDSAQSGIVTLGDEGLVQRARESVVLAYQDGYANAEQEGIVNPFEEGDPRQDHWALGQYNRRQFNENGARIENLMTQVRTTREEGQARFDRVMVEFNGIAEALLDEAERRSWCSEYESFVNMVNGRTRTLKLIPRTKTFSVYFTVTAEPPTTEQELNGISAVFDVECDSHTTYSVRATIECDPGDIDEHVDALHQSMTDCRGVIDVTHDNTEEDDD
jgi:hypothetical protein